MKSTVGALALGITAITLSAGLTSCAQSSSNPVDTNKYTPPATTATTDPSFTPAPQKTEAVVPDCHNIVTTTQLNFYGGQDYEIGDANASDLSATQKHFAEWGGAACAFTKQGESPTIFAKSPITTAQIAQAQKELQADGYQKSTKNSVDLFEKNEGGRMLTYGFRADKGQWYFGMSENFVLDMASLDK